MIQHIGLTGGIGTGKSWVAQLLQLLGYPVYFSDERAKALYYNPEVKAKVVALLGEQSFANGLINKTFIADEVFNSKEKLEGLNAIIHPAVAEDYNRWARNKLKEAPFVFKEAAILFESGGYKTCHAIVCVTAPKELRIKRVMKRDACDKETVLSRMANQWDDERKVQQSDYVIVNNEVEAIIPQVLDIIENLKKRI